MRRLMWCACVVLLGVLLASTLHMGVAWAEESAEPAPEAAAEVVPAVEQKKIEVSVRIVGTDGVWADIEGLELDEGSNAWDATRLALTESGLTYKTGNSAAQDVIVSVTRAADAITLSSDPTTGSGWHLYVNGARYFGSSSTVELADGDKVEWLYEMGTIMVSVCVVGPGGTGDSYWIAPTSVRMQATQTAWDASLAVFSQNGYDQGRLLSYTTGSDGSVYLESLAALGENGITGESWQVFVNGAQPSVDVAHVELKAGDSICWYYAGRGVTSLPPFVAQTGAASQNPAASVSIEGDVTQAWVEQLSGEPGTFSVVDHLSGVTATGAQGITSLVGEGTSLIDPVSLLLGDGGWRATLSHTLYGRLNTGEGIRSVMGLDKSLYYVGNAGNVVKLELTPWE